MATFSKKSIRAAFRLAVGEFSGGGNTVIIEGLPIDCRIVKGGGDAKNTANLTVENVSLKTANELTSLAFERRSVRNNILEIFAGSEGTELSKIFEGEISSSFPDISDGGTLSLRVEALAGYYPSLIPAEPTAVGTERQAADVISTLAQIAGYTFTNNGVTATLQNSTFTGSPVNQARTIARQCGFDFLIDDGAFIIQPFAAPRDGQIPVISKHTGLLGYPSYSSEGIRIRSIFSPLFDVGRYVKLESVLPHATGEWQVVKLEHNLEANKPRGGHWETMLTAVLPAARGGMQT